MANTLDLRRRIRSVKSTEQITRAMKMVAAARLRRAQSRITEARPYASALEGVLTSLTARIRDGRHPLLATRVEESVTLVVVTGDRGLCGAFNANVEREALALVREPRWKRIDLVLVGRKAIDFFRHKGITPQETHAELMSNVTPAAAFELARRLARRFSGGDTDAVYVLYNKFRSVIQQQVTLDQLLPIARVKHQEDGALTPYIFEPSPGALLNQLLPKHVEFQLLRMLLDSQAAEQAARMTAMDAASKNASDMIDHLTLTYNRLRQASITKELIEIVSGAQALER